MAVIIIRNRKIPSFIKSLHFQNNLRFKLYIIIFVDRIVITGFMFDVHEIVSRASSQNNKRVLPAYTGNYWNQTILLYNVFR